MLKEGMSLLWKVERNVIILQPISTRNLLDRFEGKVDYTREVKEEIEKLFLKTVGISSIR
jgi:hypothetical protein